MNPLERLDYYKNDYTNTEKEIYEWVKENPNEVIRCAIDNIAEMTGTSKAAIIRFSKKIGYNGFAEFKFELSRYIISGERRSAENDSNEIDTVKSITSLYVGYLRQFESSINQDSLNSLIQSMISSKRLKIIGNNRSGLPAMQLRMRLSKIGMDAEYITDMVLVYAYIDFIKKDDCIIVFSTYAETKVYQALAARVEEVGAHLYLITTNPKNKIGNQCRGEFILPAISRASSLSFLDDQALFFVFVEIIMAELAYKVED